MKVTALRWVVAFATAACITTGLLAARASAQRDLTPDTGFVVGLLVLLMPSAIFAVGAIQKSTVLVCGSSLIILNALAWGVYYLSNWDGIVFSFVGIAFLVTLLASVMSAAKDHGFWA